jgi:hypothetical protein
LGRQRLTGPEHGEHSEAAQDGPAPDGAPEIGTEASLAEAWTLMQEHGAPVLGVGAAAISSLLVRKYVRNALVQDWADAIGGVLGAALCLPIKYWKGDEAMSSAMVTALAYGVVTTAVKKLGPMLGVGYLVPQVSGLAFERVGYLPQLPTASAQMAAIPREVRASADISAFGRP